MFERNTNRYYSLFDLEVIQNSYTLSFKILDDKTEEPEYAFFLSVAWIGFLEDILKVHYAKSKKSE